MLLWVAAGGSDGTGIYFLSQSNFGNWNDRTLRWNFIGLARDSFLFSSYFIHNCVWSMNAKRACGGQDAC